jgi:hypothetical protein
MRWAPVVSIQMERTRPHLTKGARVDEKTNEVQTSESLEGVGEDSLFKHRVFHISPDVSLMQRTSLVCYKMQRRMQRFRLITNLL